MRGGEDARRGTFPPAVQEEAPSPVAVEVACCLLRARAMPMASISSGPAADGGEIGVQIPKRIFFSGLTTENLILSDIHANVFLSFPCFRAFLRGI